MIAATILGVAAAVLATIPLQFHLDTRRTWAAETDSDDWHGADITVLAPQPEEAQPLPAPGPLAPVRRVPGVALHPALAGGGAGAVGDAPSVELLEFVHAKLVAWNPGTQYEGRHRVLGADPTTTQEFAAIVDVTWTPDERVALLEAQWCDSCRVGWDGEQPHQSCPGCPCPCLDPALVESGARR